MSGTFVAPTDNLSRQFASLGSALLAARASWQLCKGRQEWGAERKRCTEGALTAFCAAPLLARPPTFRCVECCRRFRGGAGAGTLGAGEAGPEIAREMRGREGLQRQRGRHGGKVADSKP